MKRGLILALIILLLDGCTVQKKNYFVFDRVTLPPAKSAQVEEAQKAGDLKVIASEADAVISDTSRTPVVTGVRIAKRKDFGADGSPIDSEADLPGIQGNDSKGKTGEVKPSNFRRPGSGLLYLAAALLGLASFGLTRLKRPVNSLTRWAKANPRKAQGLIAGVHVPLLGLGLMNGYNLEKLGYDIPDTALYGLGATTLVGFLTTPFVQKPNFITLPAKVNRHRLSFLGIALSSFLLMVGVGNNTDRILPNSSVVNALAVADHSVFSQEGNHTAPGHYTTASPQERRARMAAGGMSAGAAVALIFLLCIVACAGLCLVFGGFAALFSGQLGGLLALLAGVPMFLLAIKGIKQVSQRRFETKLAEMNKATPPEK